MTGNRIGLSRSILERNFGGLNLVNFALKEKRFSFSFYSSFQLSLQMTDSNVTAPLLSSPLAAGETTRRVYDSIRMPQEEQQQDVTSDGIKVTTTEDTRHTTWRLWKSNSYAWSLATLFILFLVFTALEVALLKLNLPAVSPWVCKQPLRLFPRTLWVQTKKSLIREDQDALKIPKSLKDLRRLNEILSNYIDEHFSNVYITYFVTYI